MNRGEKMNGLLETAIKEHMCKDVDGANFYVNRYRNGSGIANLIKDVKKIIRKYNLSASQAKGFLEYMKLVIDDDSYIPPYI